MIAHLHARFHLRADRSIWAHPVNPGLGVIDLGGDSPSTTELSVIGQADDFRSLALHCLTLADQLDALSAAERRRTDEVAARRAEKQAADLEALKARIEAVQP